MHWSLKNLHTLECVFSSRARVSKVLVNEFRYDHSKNKYDNKSKLLLADADSLMYEIKTEDVYKDFSSDKEMFDFSNDLTKSKHCDNSNKLIIWKMKYETGGAGIGEFVGLKPKMYRNRNIWNQENFIVLVWWQNIYPKQWIWWTTSWLPDLIIKNSYLYKNVFLLGILF